MRTLRTSPWLVLLLLAGCPGKDKVDDPKKDPVVKKEPESVPESQPEPEPPPPKPRDPVTLTITSPKEGEVIPGKGPTSVNVSFTLTNYEVKPDGQHIHVILDNEPYQANYDISQPFVLKNVPVGSHTIRAFPSAGAMTEGMTQHESIKDPNAFAMVHFAVGKADGKHTVKATDPLLTYSRPKGEYIGEKAKKIMLDFWVKNAELGPDKYKVMYKVDAGEPVTLTKWEKVFINDLPWGEHSIELWLVGPNGKEVPGAFNHTTRKIVLKEKADPPLFERLGGQAAIEAVVDDFLKIVGADKRINKRFAKTDLAALKVKVVEQVCEATGGPCKYTGKNMVEAHTGMKITEKEFNAFVEDLTKALDKNKVPEKEKGELLGALGGMKGDIVGK